MRETRRVFALSPDVDVYEAIDVLAGNRRSCAPVVNEEGELIGILTEKDCLRVLSGYVYGELAPGLVRDYMSEVKVRITPNMDLFAVAQKFIQTNFASLPVEEDGKLIGRITRQDMLRGIQRLQRQVEHDKAEEGRAIHRLDHHDSLEDLQNLVASTDRSALATLFSGRFGGSH
jgi:CBS domain-containing protein